MHAVYTVQKDDRLKKCVLNYSYQCLTSCFNLNTSGSLEESFLRNALLWPLLTDFVWEFDNFSFFRQ